MTCVNPPIKYSDQAIQLTTDTQVLFQENDSLKANIHLHIWPRFIKPDREVIISVFLEKSTTQQFILRDTTRYHPDMLTEKTKKLIEINAPLEIRLSDGPGRLTYSLKYMNQKNGAYREAYESADWTNTQTRFRPLIAKVFADSASYLAHKQMKPLHP